MFIFKYVLGAKDVSYMAENMSCMLEGVVHSLVPYAHPNPGPSTTLPRLALVTPEL